LEEDREQVCEALLEAALLPTRLGDVAAVSLVRGEGRRGALVYWIPARKLLEVLPMVSRLVFQCMLSSLLLK
jgi:hypothetical protein